MNTIALSVIKADVGGLVDMLDQRPLGMHVRFPDLVTGNRGRVAEAVTVLAP